MVMMFLVVGVVDEVVQHNRQESGHRNTDDELILVGVSCLVSLVGLHEPVDTDDEDQDDNNNESDGPGVEISHLEFELAFYSAEEFVVSF